MKQASRLSSILKLQGAVSIFRAKATFIGLATLPDFINKTDN